MLVRTSMLELTLNIIQFYENTAALLKPLSAVSSVQRH